MGRFSDASPDPGAPPSQKEGEVWLANEWNLPATNDQSPVWRTLIYQLRP